MHPFDLFFFNASSGNYTVKRWLEDLRARFGGVDAALLWPVYPQLGIDDRNAYDMIRTLPGGLPRLRQVVAELRAEGVRVLWPFKPWDTATRYEGPEPDQILNLIEETGADGLNGDTLATIPEGFWQPDRPVALQAELGGTLQSLAWTTLGWGEDGGWSLDLSGAAPAVDLFKLLQPRRMTTICRRWDTVRTDALQHAWFNGVGYVAWENVWGVWVGMTPRDAEALRRLQPLMHYLGALGALCSEEWEPHTPTEQPGALFASKFPQSERCRQPGAPTADGGACARPTAWTVVERAGRDWPEGTAVLRVSAAEFAGCAFFDLYRGRRILPRESGGRLTLRAAVEARGFGALLALPSAVADAAQRAPPADGAAAALAAVLAGQMAMGAQPLASYSAEWAPAQQRRLTPPLPAPPAHSAPPAGAVFVPAFEAFAFRCAGLVIEPFEPERRAALGIDVQFWWEPAARNEHRRALRLGGFYLDAAPVGMRRYAAFLAATGYAPSDDTGFLREWPEWRAGRYPEGNATVPVTGVSLDEARAFCAWAGGRLPTTFEWQAAAQAGDAARVYPWGAEDDLEKRPAPTLRGRTRAPADSESLRRFANPLGLYDLVGNVWQYTESEYADEHSRFVLLRGGASYQPQAASDFQNWYFGSSDATRPGGGVRLDRHAKYFLMGASWERAATLGFRCAYDHAPPRRSGALFGGLALSAVLVLCAALLLLLPLRRWSARAWRRARASSTHDSRTALQLINEMDSDDAAQL